MHVPMQEPQSLEFDAVVATVNSAFETWRYPRYDVVFKYADGFLTVEDIPDSTSIEFPKAVNEYFGFSEGSKFTNNTRLRLKDELIKTAEEEKEDEETGTSEIPPAGRGNYILVTSNFTAQQLLNDRYFPALRVIDLQEYENDRLPFRLNFNPVVFVPLCCEELSSLRVQFVDEFNRPVKFQENSLIAVQLHFKSRF